MIKKEELKLSQFFIAVFLITSCSLVYVRMELTTIKIGYNISEKENNLTMLLDQNKYLRYNTLELASPNNLGKKLEEQNIALNFGTSQKVISLAQTNPHPGKEKLKLAAAQKLWDIFALKSQAQANTLK